MATTAKGLTLLFSGVLGVLPAAVSAQPGVTVTGPAPPCVEVRGEAQAGPAHARFRGRLPCPRPPVMVLVPPPSAQVVVTSPPPPAPALTPVYPGPATPPPPLEPATPPAPGSLHIGYVGAYTLGTITNGAQLRLAAHIDGPAFFEFAIGALGGAFQRRFLVVEVPLLLGVRVAVPVIDSVLRVYGSLTTGLVYRDMRSPGASESAASFASWTSQLGGGLEVGAPVSDTMTVGGHVDVRLQADVPAEILDPSLGVVWSAGLPVFFM